MPTVRLEDTELEYVEQGSGEPVVLVHGTLGDYRSWEAQMEPFARRYRTISYSRRYHHPNPCRGDETDYSADAHADDLAGLLAELDIDSAHIVGNSYGAYTGLFLAARHPERVRALVLGEPPVLPLLEHDTEGGALKEEFFESVWNPVGEVMQQGDEARGVKWFVDRVVGEGAFDEFPPEVQGLIMDNACEFRAETASPDFWTELTDDDAQNVTAPTLLLTGENTLSMFKRVADELETRLPNVERRRVPDSSHELPADNPSDYNRTVLDFIASH